MMRELCGALPDEVLLSHKSPADVRPYRRFFRVPVRFDAEQSALVFSASKLECPVPGADPRQRAILEASVARYWSVALPNVTDQVVRILRPRVLFGDFTLAAVAHCLTMHPRTLNRHLKAEGITFRELLNEARFEVARQLLLGTRIDITGIATALGYADTSVFSHAFRRMAGASPLEWRAGLRRSHACAPRGAITVNAPYPSQHVDPAAQEPRRGSRSCILRYAPGFSREARAADQKTTGVRRCLRRRMAAEELNLPLAISMNERLIVDVAHFKAAVPLTANCGRSVKVAAGHRIGRSV